ncbi:hypothetical protein Tco_1323193 [Tanacetum coccineum]
MVVSEKGTKKANVDLVDALDLQNRIQKLFEDFNRLLKAKKVKEANEANEAELKVKKKLLKYPVMKVYLVMKILVLYNDVKYPLSDVEIRMFKERPTTSTSTRSRALTASTRSRALIASTSNAQAASAPLRGHKKIAMTRCVLGLRAPNDPNAPPPLTT